MAVACTPKKPQQQTTSGRTTKPPKPQQQETTPELPAAPTSCTPQQQLEQRSAQPFSSKSYLIPSDTDQDELDEELLAIPLDDDTSYLDNLAPVKPQFPFNRQKLMAEIDQLTNDFVWADKNRAAKNFKACLQRLRAIAKQTRSEPESRELMADAIEDLASKMDQLTLDNLLHCIAETYDHPTKQRIAELCKTSDEQNTIQLLLRKVAMEEFTLDINRLLVAEDSPEPGRGNNDDDNDTSDDPQTARLSEGELAEREYDRQFAYINEQQKALEKSFPPPQEPTAAAALQPINTTLSLPSRPHQPETHKVDISVPATPRKATTEPKPVASIYPSLDLADELHNQFKGEDRSEALSRVKNQLRRIQNQETRKITANLRTLARTPLTPNEQIKTFGDIAGLMAVADKVCPPGRRTQDVVRTNTKQPSRPVFIHNTLIELLQLPVLRWRNMTETRIAPRQVREWSIQQLREKFVEVSGTYSEKQRECLLENLPALQKILRCYRFPFSYSYDKSTPMPMPPEPFGEVAICLYERWIGFPMLGYADYDYVGALTDSEKAQLMQEIFKSGPLQELTAVLTSKKGRGHKKPEPVYSLGRVAHTDSVLINMHYAPANKQHYLVVALGNNEHYIPCTHSETAEYLGRQRSVNLAYQAIGKPMVRDDGNEPCCLVLPDNRLPKGYKPI